MDYKELASRCLLTYTTEDQLKTYTQLVLREVAKKCRNVDAGVLAMLPGTRHQYYFSALIEEISDGL